MDTDRAAQGSISDTASTPSTAQLQRRYRVRISIFVGMSLLTAGALGTVYRAANTLQRLAAVEAERDLWQRPNAVIGALDLEMGHTVADLGCGAGYFAMKLAPRVGESGRVLAVDVARFPLLFLRLRALLAHHHGIETVLGEENDPRLPEEAIDAVLVANTYHELTDAPSILDHAFRALRPGGRLVVLDPGVGADGEGPHDCDHHHLVSPGVAESQLRRAGFEVLDRQDRFVDRDRNVWWLLKARRPPRGAAVRVGSSDRP